jgi:hypothetical protein
MAARESNTILCPVCRQGRNGSSLKMPKHNITPWEPCSGAGEEGSLPDEVEHYIINARFALVSAPPHWLRSLRSMWRWVCNCGQVGALVDDEERAWSHGHQHVSVAQKKQRGGI